jgi:hypothetical protein
MAQAQSRKSITVINPAPDFALPGISDEMISADVSLDSLKASMKELIEECREVFREAATASGDGRVAHVDLSLAISVDGSVGLFGTPGANAGGGITVRLEFGDASQAAGPVH